MYAALAIASAADRLAASDPALAALVPGPIAANSSLVMARRAMAQGQIEAALASSRDAIAAAPAHPEALGLLGNAQFGAGNAGTAAAAFAAASQRGWRDRTVQGYLFEQALAAGDAGRAALHLDALFRTQPADPRLVPALDRVLALPGGDAALAARFEEGARWSNALFVGLGELPGDVLARRADLVSTAVGRGLLSCEETRGFRETAASRGIRITACAAPGTG